MEDLDMDTVVVMVNYHCEKEILRLSNSDALSQYPILIVDNSQSNRLQEKSEQSSKIAYHRKRENQGFAGGINTSIQNFNGFKYVFVLNPDCHIESENLVPELVSTAKRHSLNILSPTVRNHNGERYPLPNRTNVILEWMGVLPSLPQPHDEVDYSHHVHGCAMLIRTTVFDDIGQFNDEFFLYMEEVEFCYRAVQNGYSPAIQTKVSLVHEESSGELRHEENYQAFYRNRNIFLLGRERFSGIARGKYYCVQTLAMITRMVQLVQDRNWSIIIPWLCGVYNGITGRFGKSERFST